MREKSKQAILVVSFGTSYNENIEKTIGAIEQDIQDAYPDYEVRRAFTSQIIINILKKRDGLVIDNFKEALDRALKDGIRTLIVQPTYMMSGREYTDMAGELEGYRDRFEHLALGAPVLASTENFEQVIREIRRMTVCYDNGETAICLMGHGTEAAANSVYTELQEYITEAGYTHYYIGTVEAGPSLEDIFALIDGRRVYQRIILEPLMVVCGDHANNDMAGSGRHSWKSVFEREGYEVVCVMRGLGELPGIRKIYISHVRAAIDSL